MMPSRLGRRHVQMPGPLGSNDATPLHRGEQCEGGPAEDEPHHLYLGQQPRVAAPEAKCVTSCQGHHGIIPCNHSHHPTRAPPFQLSLANLMLTYRRNAKKTLRQYGYSTD